MSPPRRLLLITTALASASPALAQDEDARVAALEARVAAQHEQIESLKRQLVEQAALLRQLVGAAETEARPTKVAPERPTRVAAAPPSPPVAESETGFSIPGLDVSGDLRLREEFNFSDRDGRDRARTVLRARLRASYAVSDTLTAGVQIATGDPDDPNTADVTLGSFVDDLQISLDQAWLRYARGGLTLYGGKFPQIFARTDMVWDGDVAPQGVGAIYAVPLGADASVEARAIHFIIDEATGGPDSSMTGGQFVIAAPLGSVWRLSFAGGYYDYALDSLAGADAGDFRDNLIVGGRYLSDFNLAEGLARLSFTGIGERWPLSLTADYVRNFGAAVDADEGFNLELAAGRSAVPGDWRFAYNYSEVGVDAVFAAFSHDNLAIATNYRLHGLSVGYVLTPNVGLDANLYHYRPLSPLYAGAHAPDDWLNRARLNLVVQF